MDFQLSAKAQELSANMWEFLNTRVLPAEAEYDAYRTAAGPDDHTLPPVVDVLKAEARARGLWN
ncbi:MAG: acyl-CoA dehydrogenase, partial [Actinobacteria bacterium]|nr:acyl-CoA dehydrogenase [Actinomycetota bacterium]